MFHPLSTRSSFSTPIRRLVLIMPHIDPVNLNKFHILWRWENDWSSWFTTNLILLLVCLELKQRSNFRWPCIDSAMCCLLVKDKTLIKSNTNERYYVSYWSVMEFNFLFTQGLFSSTILRFLHLSWILPSELILPLCYVFW